MIEKHAMKKSMVETFASASMTVVMSVGGYLATVSTVYAHTNSVGFIVGDENTDGAGVGLGTFDVEFFYGTWHTPFESAEGGLEVWEMTDTEFTTYTDDPASTLAGDPDFGTKLIDPAGGGTAIPFAISPLFPVGSPAPSDYRNTADLPEDFTAGVNYFYSGTVTAADGTVTRELIGEDGADYSSTFTDSDGNSFVVDSGGPYQHQSATTTLTPGNYRFYYDAVTDGGPDGLSFTWEPQDVIRYIGLSISSTGSLEVSGADPVEDQRPGVVPAVETTTGRSVLERVLASTRTISSDITAIFGNTADNLGAVGNVFLRDNNRVTIIVASRDTTGTVTFSEVEAVFDAQSNEWIDPLSGDAIASVQSIQDLANGQQDYVIRDFMLSEGDNLFSDGSGVFYAYDPFAVETAGFGEADGVVLAGLEVPRFAADANVVVDSSILNIITGLDASLASLDSDVAAFQPPDVEIGNLSTTGIGSVNTGDIFLDGANTELSETIDTALAETTQALQRAIRANVRQVGLDTDGTVVALNASFNEMNVNASVRNLMSGVNATIGRSGFENNTAFDASSISGLFADAATATDPAVAAEIASAIPASIEALTGGISTTALGAVNTGTIVSGAQQDVVGVVSSIVGDASTNVSQ
jgi:hypothetical protein